MSAMKIERNLRKTESKLNKKQGKITSQVEISKITQIKQEKS